MRPSKHTALPINAVTFSGLTAVFKDIPNTGCFSAKADRDIPVEAANGID